MITNLQEAAIWQDTFGYMEKIMMADARLWRKNNPDFARVLNPNNHYKK